MPPYPGGKQGPGHYIGGTIGNLIFLRAVGEWYIKIDDGSNVNIDLPVRQANDDLFVFVNSLFTEALAPTGWTQVQTHTVAAIIGAVQLFHRVASNDANDNFLIPAIVSVRNRVAQMAAFGNTDPNSPPNFLTQIQSGSAFNTSQADLDYSAMIAGADPSETFVLFLATHFRIGESGAVTTSPNLDDDLAEIDSLAVSQGLPNDDRINITWSWDYQDVSVSVPAGSIAYTVSQFGANFSQYSRWNLQ